MLTEELINKRSYLIFDLTSFLVVIDKLEILLHEIVAPRRQAEKLLPSAGSAQSHC